MSQQITFPDSARTVPPAEAQADLSSAMVIVNADDWGCTAQITDRIFDCIRRGTVSSTSAMVFMEDSERAAVIAREYNLDAGLHLNLTARFTGAKAPPELARRQEDVSRYLRSHRYAPAVFNPFLARSFEYVVRHQLEEFERLYGGLPGRIDGHHHMHLCSNVLFQKLLPGRTIVRRNFTFGPQDKSVGNRLYRALQDKVLNVRHRSTDSFFDLVPLERERLVKILDAARATCVEIEAHPGLEQQYEFLMSGGLQSVADDVETARGYHLRRPGRARQLPNCTTAAPENNLLPLPHIAVCICTYQRPEFLMRLLDDLGRQKTDGAFTYSIVVADNDKGGSAKQVVEEARSRLLIPVKYCSEPDRGIARARNKVIENAEGDYVALIDDDEFPEPYWLLNLLRTYQRYRVAGVLGPVKRFLEPEAPQWLRRSSLYDRPVNPTGLEVRWREARTGNVLLNRAIFAGDPVPFRPEFKAGEDQDFFQRKIQQGYRFVWSSDAVVSEVLPRARWSRKYYMRKALMQGANAALQPDCGILSIAKSLLAVPLYALALPLAFLMGQHRFMTLLVKLCDHGGKLLGRMKINPVREEYVSG